MAANHSPLGMEITFCREGKQSEEEKAQDVGALHAY
jgi:hypothetical protein